jgi:rubredoxin
MDTDDIMSCEKCGVFFDVNIVKKRKGTCSGTYFICPICKHENYDYD